MAWAGTELGVWGLNRVRVWASWARLRCRSCGWGRALIGRAEGQVSQWALLLRYMHMRILRSH